MRFAVVDLETTGGRPQEDRIIEVGVALMDDLEITKTYNCLVCPGRNIPPFVQGLTGITPEMVAMEPQFASIAETVSELVAGRVFVAHNVAFDYGFLKAELWRSLCHFDAPRLCTVKLSRKFFPGFPSYSLHKLAKSLSIPDFRHHRALDDALAAAEILKLVIDKAGEPKLRREIKNVSTAKLRVCGF